MKRTILLCTLVFTFFYGYSFPGRKEENISERAKKSFQNEFADAEHVQWEDRGLFAIATFTLDEQLLCAYFNTDGELLAVGRNILSTQLPLHLSATLKKQYPRCWIVELLEVSYDDGASTYYVKLQDGDRETVLESRGNIDWGLYKKRKKHIARPIIPESPEKGN